MTESQMIVPRNVEDEMKESYLRYSMSVIISRALPDVRDGLKPSQRRILYAMKLLNLGPGSKHRKCAKICGDTSGDFHPHGEMVIYPTLVRMAQSWMMGYPLIQGQGNFGSVDGDPPAAMRYAEARLTPSAIQLMADLEKDTVDYIPNYDETKMEPTVFPSRFPNLLCNGSSGIAVGMATNIPPHNLGEVIDGTLLLLENPQTTIDELLQVIPGPDFPTGGIICGLRGIREAYHTGRGKLTLRGVYHLEDFGPDDSRERIVLDEIPFNVNKSRLVEQIANLIHNKVVTGIADLRDESDKDGMRIVIELKKNEVPDVIINKLYKYSDLQVTFGCNVLALDKGLPRTMTIKHMITSWVDHRIEVIRRRTRFELDKAETRAHILEGYLKALDHLDEVVKLIRASANRDIAKIDLMDQFGFSDKQAHAVLDLRLYQLTGLERGKIEDEHRALQERIAYFKALLASEQMVRDLIKEDLIELKEFHKPKRRTQIIAAEGEFNMEDLIANEPVVITISDGDYIKRMPVETFREQRRGGQGVSGAEQKREGDTVKSLYFAKMHDFILIFTSFGRCYWLKVWQLPEATRKAKGKALINLLEGLQEGERVATVLRVSSFEDEEAYILLATKKGIVKKTELKAFSNPRRKGIFAITIDENDEVVGAHIVHPEKQVMLFTKKGMAVRFDQSAVRAMGRIARGVKGVSLKSADDEVVGSEVVAGDEAIFVVSANGFGKRSNVGDFRQTNRGAGGVKSIIINERNGDVIGAVSVTDQDGMLLMSQKGQTLRLRVDSVRVMGRNTQGVRLLTLKKSEDRLVTMQKLVAFAEEEEADEESPIVNEEAAKEVSEEAPKVNEEATRDTSEEAPKSEE